MSGPRQTFTERDPRHHTAKIKEMLDKTARHCGEDIPKITESKAQALFETTAKVLKGFIRPAAHANTGLMYANTVADSRRALTRGFTTVLDMAGPTFGTEAAIDA